MSVLCPPPKDSADDISVFCHQAESEPKSGLLMTRDMERVFWFYQSLPNPIHHEAWSQGRKIARFQGRIIARFQRRNIECFQGRNIECFQGRNIARFQERNNTRRRLDWRSIRIWVNRRGETRNIYVCSDFLISANILIFIKNVNLYIASREKLRLKISLNKGYSLNANLYRERCSDFLFSVQICVFDANKNVITDKER